MRAWIASVTARRVSALGLLLFALGVLWQSRGLPLGSLQRPGPAFVPSLLAALLGALALLMLVTGRDSPPLRSLGWTEAPHAAAVLAACGFAALTLERLGYRLTTAVVLAFLLGLVERNRPSVVVALALGFSLVSHWMFTRLGVLLPQGPLGF